MLLFKILRFWRDSPHKPLEPKQIRCLQQEFHQDVGSLLMLTSKTKLQIPRHFQSLIKRTS